MHTTDSHTVTIDWIAVAQVVVHGHHMHLIEPEQTEAVRQMYRRAVPTDQIARRLYITGRTVARIALRLGIVHPDDLRAPDNHHDAELAA